MSTPPSTARGPRHAARGWLRLDLRRSARAVGRAAGAIATLFVFVAAAGTEAQAAPPQIRAVTVPGLKFGAKSTITVDGADLLPEPKLVLPFAAPVPKLLPNPTAAKVQFEVDVPATVPAGLYSLRLLTPHGVSNPVPVAVDALDQRPFAAEAGPLPCALHGTLSGSQVLRTTFAGKKGETVRVEVESNRIGGRARPVIHLLDAQRRQLAWAWPRSEYSGDSRLEVILPADGTFTFELHDLQYASPAPGTFRLKLGMWETVDRVFPPAVETGKSADVLLLGAVPAKSTMKMSAGPSPGTRPVPLSGPMASRLTGPQVPIVVSRLREIVLPDTNPPAAPTEAGATPVAVSGRLLAAGEQDRFRLTVEPEKKYSVEVFAERLGSPLDAVVEVFDPKGALLVRGDDAADTTDPKVEFTVPKETTSVEIAVSDLQLRGDAGAVWRVVAIPAGDASFVPPFRLLLDESRLQLAAGEPTVVRVGIERTGYDGPIKLAFSSLPAGVQVQGLDIPANASAALLTFVPKAGPPAPGSVAVGELHGTAVEKGPAAGWTIRAEATDHPLSASQPWVRHELAAAVVPASGLKVQIAPASAQERWFQGIDRKLAVTVARPAETTGPVRLSFLVGQTGPLVNGKPDANKTVRAAAAEIPADKDAGELALTVPVDVPELSYGLSVKAELLTANKQTVLATAYAPVTSVPFACPIETQPVGTAKSETAANGTRKVMLAGKLVRHVPTAGDVTVTLTGLGKTLKAPTAVLKGEEADFQLVLDLPKGAAPEEFQDAAFSASFPPNPKVANALVRSRPVPVKVPPEPPAAK